jgi:hypothetical protein
VIAAVGRWFARQLALTVSAAIILVVVIALAIRSHLPVSAPFSLRAMQAHAEVTVTNAKDASRLLSTFTGRPTDAAYLRPISQPRHLVFRVQFRPGGRTKDGGQLALFVIDNRLRKPLDHVFAFGAVGDDFSQGWDSRYQRLVDKYDWLASLAEVPDDHGGYTDPMAIGWKPGTSGPVMIDAVLDHDALPVTDPGKDVSVVLAYLGDSRGAWAVRVPITTAG